jgi:flagellar protein FlbD
MIALTKLDAKQLVLDPDRIERADADPATVLTMVDGTKHMVKEDISEVIDRVRASWASALAGGRPLAGPGLASVTELVAQPKRKACRL